MLTYETMTIFVYSVASATSASRRFTHTHTKRSPKIACAANGQHHRPNLRPMASSDFG
jgi:hypothetical protein